MPRPWRLAFEAPADLPALRQVLLGINAHVNYDLPQALLAVIPTRSSQTRLGSTPASATMRRSTGCCRAGWRPRTQS